MFAGSGFKPATQFAMSETLIVFKLHVFRKGFNVKLLLFYRLILMCVLRILDTLSSFTVKETSSL